MLSSAIPGQVKLFFTVAVPFQARICNGANYLEWVHPLWRRHLAVPRGPRVGCWGGSAPALLPPPLQVSGAQFSRQSLRCMLVGFAILFGVNSSKPLLFDCVAEVLALTGVVLHCRKCNLIQPVAECAGVTPGHSSIWH